ncbi:hypothetical protein [Paenirhodobacter sp. CAU 1674]|uniref:hypothetical protein n=1 Tax=Paenirhodobacter sp. CAU 1674 TaxID=3032596 RepID=UPI0023DC4ED8|nr:hypothetical protein [Paenirhodobacter sp. CAU 1674]MDF2141217.1 hypothetical protein [Paenirhodobacter sp. CAU 1674]
MARPRDTLTGDLFSWQPPTVAVGYSAEVTGRGALDNRIARLIGHALRDAREDGMSRAEVARRMTDWIKRPISESMLNKWSSEGSEDHRIPLDAFIALVQATGNKQLLGFAPGEFGLTVIETEYAELIEAHLLDEHIEELQARRQVLSARRRARR